MKVKLQFDNDTPETKYLQKEMKNSIQKAVDSLAPKCKEIFCMSRYEGLTYHEIAAILGISVKTVETQISRAFKSLRKQLTQFFEWYLF